MAPAPRTPRKLGDLNCPACNRAFKWHSSLQIHQQRDCPKRPARPAAPTAHTYPLGTIVLAKPSWPTKPAYGIWTSDTYLVQHGRPARISALRGVYGGVPEYSVQFDRDEDGTYNDCHWPLKETEIVRALPPISGGCDEAEQATPYNADELLEWYRPMGGPAKYRFVVANFETETCSRCGGGGEYSFNQLTGTRCFRCNGAGFTLTKRGQAALNYYRDSQRRPVRELAPETLVLDQDGKRCTFMGLAPVSSHRLCKQADGTYERYQDSHTMVSYTLRYANTTITHTQAWDATLRVRPTAAEQEQQRQAALAYQATLTKQGKPSAVRKAIANGEPVASGGCDEPSGGTSGEQAMYGGGAVSAASAAQDAERWGAEGLYSLRQVLPNGATGKRLAIEYGTAAQAFEAAVQASIDNPSAPVVVRWAVPPISGGSGADEYSDERVGAPALGMAGWGCPDYGPDPMAPWLSDGYDTPEAATWAAKRALRLMRDGATHEQAIEKAAHEWQAMQQATSTEPSGPVQLLVWNMEVDGGGHGAELIGTYLRTDEDGVLYRPSGGHGYRVAPQDCVMVLPAGRKPCTCAMQDVGTGETGPRLEITSPSELCPTHGRQAQPAVWAEGDRYATGYAMAGIANLLRNTGLQVGPDQEDLCMQLLVLAEQAIDNELPEDDGYNHERAIGRVADALKALYGVEVAA